MDLPHDIAALVDDLRQLAFTLEHAEDHQWPGGPYLELNRRSRRGVRAVRMSVDRGIWEVEVQLGLRWYEPSWALRTLEGKPDQRRALSHAERRKATVGAVRNIRGTWRERRKLRARTIAHQRRYTEWAQGKGPRL